MRSYGLARAVVVPAAGIWVLLLLALAGTTAALGEGITEAGVHVLTRGPIHEAFAEASMTGAVAGVVITTAPPDPIVELPPDQRPEGANMAWIPGYWSWDDDRSDFIWVSGVWRDLPPGRQWIPGYWATTGRGSEWISGYWGDVAQTEVTYLPPPPEPLEAGPSSPRPAPDNLWTPGCWVWQQTRYDWQPGYWVPQQPDWVWSSAYYTWTPRGHVYVPGYWDHDIVHRGVMFAPIYYEQPVYTRPRYSYSPTTVIDLAVIVANLFVQPRSHRYYYGDYYDTRYEDRGIYPWHSRQIARYGDDPIYVHYRATQLRRDADWDAHMDELYRYRRDHVDARPSRTLALQSSRTNMHRLGGPEDLIIGRSLTEEVRSPRLPLRFTPLNIEERRQIETSGREVRRFESERARIETQPTTVERSEGSHEVARPVRVRLPVSPVAARPAGDVAGVRTPPPVPVAPRPRVAEVGDRQIKPRKVETRSAVPTSGKRPGVETHPERTATRSAPRSENPQHVVPRPETSKREGVAPRTRARTTRTVDTPRPQKVEARSEAKAPEPPKRRVLEPERYIPTHEEPKAEVRSQKPEHKTQAPRSGAKKRSGIRR